MITAGISLTGVILSYLSVRKMGKQIAIQKNQWEYSQKPIFRIIKSHNFKREQNWVFIVENTNNVFYRIDSVTFSIQDVKVSDFSQGSLKISSAKEREEYSGLSFTLTPQVNTFINGTIQIRGRDLLGNQFICNSPSIKFNQGDIVDHFDFYKVFFEFIKLG